MVVAHGLIRPGLSDALARTGFNDLDENRARPYSGAHDRPSDHFHRSPPPPRSRGTGGHLRLRYQPLPPDPVRGSLLQKRGLIWRLLRQAGV
jgi:hypothetical protein